MTLLFMYFQSIAYASNQIPQHGTEIIYSCVSSHLLVVEESNLKHITIDNVRFACCKTSISVVGTLECGVTMALQIAHKTQGRVVLGPGNGVVAVTDCTGGAAV